MNYSTNEQMKESFIKISAEQAVGSEEVYTEEALEKVYTLNGIDLKRLIDGMDLGKVRLEPDQKIYFHLNDTTSFVVESVKETVAGDVRVYFIPKCYIEEYDDSDIPEED